MPLDSFTSDSTIIDQVYQTRLSLSFSNPLKSPLEAVFKFPLSDGAAVCGFSAVVDGVVIDGVVQEKEEAFKNYDEAISKGHGAFLGEQSGSDFFSISVGNLPPNKKAIIVLSYVGRCASEGESLRFSLTLAVVPR